MALMCPPISLAFQLALPVPRPPPSASEKKRIRRNLFNTSPGDSDIDQLLAQEQRSTRLYLKERYGLDILQEDRRDQELDANTDPDADADASNKCAPRGMRYPTIRTISSADADDEYDPKTISQEPTGVALTAAQISSSAQLILKNGTHISSSADLSNSTRQHGQKPYATQPQGLKGIYRVRKANKGISKSKSTNIIICSSNNNKSNNNTSELNTKEQ
ncbi:gliolectin [Drosophila eugracilis]|uniref:gliolectin n=1 Tax=Drosophila eugracilis TaxID=29029 RepID=UPI0007E6EBEF|nr:gliolectin [Drosophila eugracilis]